MALVDTQIGTLTANDGSTCAIICTADDVTSVVDHFTIINSTPLPATFWVIWKTTTFTQAIAPGQTQTWTPTNKQIKWATDAIQFGWGLG